jgi:hypothetical protein
MRIVGDGANESVDLGMVDANTIPLCPRVASVRAAMLGMWAYHGWTALRRT